MKWAGLKTPRTEEIIVNRWIGEKYDGIRFCWHPKRKQMYLIVHLQFLILFPRPLPSIVYPLLLIFIYKAKIHAIRQESFSTTPLYSIISVCLFGLRILVCYSSCFFSSLLSCLPSSLLPFLSLFLLKSNRMLRRILMVIYIGLEDQTSLKPNS